MPDINKNKINKDGITMNLDKLEVGMVVRNYKTLCEMLGEKIKNHNDKTAQIKKLETHIKFEKIGNSFKILEIYKEPLKVIDNRDKIGRAHV